MKIQKLVLVLTLFLFQLQVYGNDSLTTIRLTESVDRLNTEMANLRTEMHSVNNNQLTQDGNFVSTTANLIAFLSLFSTVFSIGVALWGSQIIKSAKNQVREVKQEAKTTKEDFDKAKFEVSNKTSEVLQKASEALNNSEEVEKMRFSVEHKLKEIENLKDELEQKYNNMLLISPLYSDGIRHLDAGDIDIAIDKFNHVLSIDQNNISAKGALAMCYSGIDDIVATRKITELISSGNANSETFVFAGIIARRAGDYDQAIKLFENAIELELKKPAPYQVPFSIYNHLAYTHLYKEKLEKAAECFKKAKAIRNNNSASLYGLLKISFLRTRSSDPTKEQLADVNSAIKIVSRDAHTKIKSPFYKFGLLFACMCPNTESVLCENVLKLALDGTSNLGILKEQLREYKIFKSYEVNLNSLTLCIEQIEARIAELEKINVEIINRHVSSLH
jgi:tetratricopeptide (TPR) repeat protein